MTINNFVNRSFVLYSILKPAFDRLSPFAFDGAGRIYMLLSLLVLIVNLNNIRFWSTIKIPSIFTWFVWCVYASIAWVVIGVNDSGLSPSVFLLNKIFISFFILYISCYESKHDPDGFSKMVLYAFILYTLIGIVFNDAGVAREDNKMGNNLPLNALCMFAIAGIRYIKGWDKSRMFFISLILFTLTVFISETRKALMTELILILFIIYIKFKITNLKNIVFLIVIIFGLYFLSGYVFENTGIGDRFSNISQVGERYNTSDYAILDLLGDRAYFYINGWELFLDNPIFGIGIRNFAHQMNADLPIHSEYIVQLCETGIIGTILFIVFYGCYFKKLARMKNYPNEKNMRIFFYAWAAVMLFLSLTTWTYEFPRYFCITGFILGYCESLKHS